MPRPPRGPRLRSTGVDTQMHVLAGRGTRLGAHIVDSLLYAGSIIPGAILLGIGAGNNQDVAIGLGAALMGLCALGFLIFQVYLISTSGQSLGKRWLGIKIVKVDGTEPGFVHGWLLRGFLMYILTTVLNVATMVLGSVLGLVNVLMIFGDERRCLHDHIAGTKVIIAGQ